MTLQKDMKFLELRDYSELIATYEKAATLHVSTFR
jgi:hypothetical protein